MRSSGHSSTECVAQREGGNGGDYEAFGEEEKEDVAQEWPEWGDVDEDENEDVYLGNRGFDALLSVSQPMPMDKMFPLVFGPPAQTQLMASITPQAHPIARRSTQQHSQQPQQQSSGTI